MDPEDRYVADRFGIVADTPYFRYAMTFPDGRVMECAATVTEVARMIEQEPGTTCRRIDSP